MHLAYVVSQYPSLTETFIAREVNQLVDLGHDVTLCVLRPRPPRGPQGISAVELRTNRMPLPGWHLLTAQLSQMRVARGRFWRNWSLPAASFKRPSRLWQVVYLQFAASWFAERLSACPVDYIHSHFLHNEAICAMMLAGLMQVPYGITAHVSSIRHDRRLVRQVVSFADVLVGDTQQTLEVCRELAGRSATLVRNGIDLSEVEVASAAGRASNAIPVILAVGSLLQPKGFHILILACAHLRERGVLFRCRVVGEGPERSNLEALIAEMNLCGYVSLIGAMTFDELRKQYGQATVLVMPSVTSALGSDGLPTVLIEAMAMGIPVIGTRHAGIPDLVHHRETGLLVEPGDADGLAACIADMLGDAALRERVVARGQQLVRKDHDLTKNVTRLASLIAQAVRVGQWEESESHQ